MDIIRQREESVCRLSTISHDRRYIITSMTDISNHGIENMLRALRGEDLGQIAAYSG